MESAVQREAEELHGPWSCVEGNLAFTSKTLSSITQMSNRFSKTKQNSSQLAFTHYWLPDCLEEAFSFQTYLGFKLLVSIETKSCCDLQAQFVSTDPTGAA